MGGVLFFNGPVQNGTARSPTAPAKPRGCGSPPRLNQLLGAVPAPHLWNTATLAGDLRHRAHDAADGPATRAAFEAELIAAMYGTGQAPEAGTATDADPEVAALALEMVEDRLRTGDLALRREALPHCARCGHMAGPDSTCKACGGETMHTRARVVLVAERASDRPVLGADDVHAHRKRAPRQTIAGHVPPRLVLSRTRDHGISLEPLGMPGLVLDPRAGLHATVVASAAARSAATAVMVLTDNAAAHVAAYRQPFLRHGGVRLVYGLDGHIPYDHVPGLDAAYRRCRFTAADRAVFETWFLPLYSWHAKNDIAPGQLPALLAHFHRARLAAPRRPEAAASVVRGIQRAVQAGGTDWLTHKTTLAAAVAAGSQGKP